MNIEWNDCYRVGDERIDLQHQRLFGLANAILRATDQDTYKLAAINLYGYIRKHFADEEALMREVHFPLYRAHVEMHNAMVSRFNAISQAIGRGQWSRDEIRAFMSDWLLHHIGTEDTQLAAHIHKRPGA
jgi:hemerythrin